MITPRSAKRLAVKLPILLAPLADDAATKAARLAALGDRPAAAAGASVDAGITAIQAMQPAAQITQHMSHQGADLMNGGWRRP